MSYRGLKRCNLDTHVHTHTRAHTYTSGRQLKFIFLDVLGYSEYYDINILEFFFSRKHSFRSEEAKTGIKSEKN